MKIKLGPYVNWIGPFQLAEKLLFWMDSEDDRVYKLGHFFAYGSYSRHKTVSMLLDEGTNDQETWLYKVLNWVHDKKKRKVSIKIDSYDTWSMDHTLALIIVPMLKQLKANKHGSPHVDNKDVPEELRVPKDYDGFDTDPQWHNRWDWVMDEMIWSFEQIIEDPDVPIDDYEEHYKRVKRGTTLFGKYYQGLWD
jgi:hypothetical protein